MAPPRISDDPGRAFARALIEALDEPALIVERGSIRLANAAAHHLLGDGVEGRDVRLSIRHPQALEYILGHRAADLDVVGIAGRGRSWRLHTRVIADGSVLVRMIDRSDGVSAEKMRVDFVANASHELRTPLSTILGYAETLAEESGLPDDVRSGFGRTIRDEAGRMLRIIEDLMSLSRIEADRFVAPQELVDIGQVITTVLADGSRLRARAECEVDVTVADGLPLVRGDRAQLAQLLDNLVANAVRYGCDRSGASIAVSAAIDGGWMALTVADTGPGIAKEHLPRVTERFYRADPARSRDSGGTGLGLAIVKHIVERHRGELDIQSSTGVGTTVTVRLRIAD
ncbi:MAG: ATP-binding protein [Sphingomicrobium sp.]